MKHTMFVVIIGSVAFGAQIGGLAHETLQVKGIKSAPNTKTPLSSTDPAQPSPAAPTPYQGIPMRVEQRHHFQQQPSPTSYQGMPTQFQQQHPAYYHQDSTYQALLQQQALYYQYYQQLHQRAVLQPAQYDFPAPLTSAAPTTPSSPSATALPLPSFIRAEPELVAVRCLKCDNTAVVARLPNADDAQIQRPTASEIIARENRIRENMRKEILQMLNKKI